MSLADFTKYTQKHRQEVIAALETAIQLWDGARHHGDDIKGKLRTLDELLRALKGR